MTLSCAVGLIGACRNIIKDIQPCHEPPITAVTLGKIDPVTIPDLVHSRAAQVLGAGLFAGAFPGLAIPDLAIPGLMPAHTLVDRDHGVPRAGTTVVTYTPLPASLAGHSGVGPRSALARA